MNFFYRAYCRVFQAAFKIALRRQAEEEPE